MIYSLIRRLARSKRVVFALISNGLVSLASFLLSVSVARTSTIEGFAEFSFAMVSFLFITGLNRAAFTNTALSHPEDRESYKRSSNRSLLVALLWALMIGIWALSSENPFLMILSLTMPGMILLDHIRTYNSAAERPLLSLSFSSFWSAVTVFVSVGSFFYESNPLIVFGAWAVSGSAGGVVATIVSRLSIVPRWPKEKKETSEAFVFSADYLVGAGGAQLTTGLLGILADAKILGAIRGSGTLLGPVNLISTTARSLLLPFLSRENSNSGDRFKPAVAAALVQSAVLVPVLAILQFIPDDLGFELLGETWKVASLAILPMSIDALFNVAMSPAIAGHRVSSAGSRSLVIRLLVGVPRPIIVVYCASVWGVLGAAWAMAFVALASSVAWWISYFLLCRRESETY